MIALQLGIAATGNYGFFNLLTIVLYLAVLDDHRLEGLWGMFRRKKEAAKADLPDGDTSPTPPRS
jgi:hypothetical protein